MRKVCLCLCDCYTPHHSITVHSCQQVLRITRKEKPEKNKLFIKNIYGDLNLKQGN